MNVTGSPEWKRLVELGSSSATLNLGKEFDKDPARSTRFAREVQVGAEALYVDFSKQLVNEAIIKAFGDVIEASGVCKRRDDMFAGVHVNTTEDRPALHTALRAPQGSKIMVDGVDVVTQVHKVRDDLSAFAAKVASGEIRGSTGKSFTHVLNIGIGGSELGPSLLYNALSTLHTPKLTCSFVSGLDTTNLDSQLKSLDPESTLVVISSKTFSTFETVANAKLVQQWLAAAIGKKSVGKHCVVVTAMPERVEQQDIQADYSFPIWSWVGGRFSISSAVSAAVVIAFGGDIFGQFLDGMHAMDEHFATTPVTDNLPMLLGMLDVWNTSILNFATRAVVPYSTALELLPNYLQQLEMESNGKHVTSDGLEVTVKTAPVVWGGVGTDAQHAFMQLLHQGTQIVPAEFIAFASPSHSHFAEQDALIANMFAQSQAMAFGRLTDEASPHQEMPGNRPSTVIIGTRLTPAILGALISLSEHKVFVAGCVWGINSFDQWGVEAGKSLAIDIIADFKSGARKVGRDSSTSQLMKWYIEHRARP
ncbi:MAG: glucose-6-phosphate isomerase [Ilumatobacteraceae bacterium]